MGGKERKQEEELACGSWRGVTKIKDSLAGLGGGSLPGNTVGGATKIDGRVLLNGTTPLSDCTSTLLISRPDGSPLPALLPPPE